MLNDNSYYNEIPDESAQKIFTTIKELFSSANDISSKEKEYLINFDYKTSTFYGLPKIHKSKIVQRVITENKSEYIEIKDPEDLTFRPIVAGPICETHRLSNLLDILLKPFIKHMDSYIQDDVDF